MCVGPDSVPSFGGAGRLPGAATLAGVDMDGVTILLLVSVSSGSKWHMAGEATVGGALNAGGT
jgi:hypothetical protein